MKKIVRLSAIAFIALAMVSVIGCEGLLTEIIATLDDVTGKVVNAKALGTSTEYYKSASDTLVGATITLTNQDATGDDASTTVLSDGSFRIADPYAGRYLVTGTKDGWTFVPRLVDISGYSDTIPTVIAYPTPSDLNQILVLVEWENTAYDVDSYMVRDTDGDAIYDGAIVAGYDNDDLVVGFSYYSDPEEKITLDRDVTEATSAVIPRVETISINAPVNVDNVENLRYYLRMWTPTGSLTGDDNSLPATATVFVMQGITHYGTYPIAYNTYEDVLGVVAMEWDPITDLWSIGSFGGAWLNGDGENTAGIKSITSIPVAVDAIQ